LTWRLTWDAGLPVKYHGFMARSAYVTFVALTIELLSVKAESLYMTVAADGGVRFCE
jgi:hypothetical protein